MSHRPSPSRLRTGCVALLIAGFAVLAPSVSSAQAACTSTWNGGSGAWETAGNWTPSGVPSTSADVCIEAEGTYTVSMSSGQHVNSLSLGAATTTGAQTLAISAANFNTNLTADGGIVNGPRGAIIVDCPVLGCAGGGAPNIDVRASTLTNAGTITVTPLATGLGSFAGAVTNTGTIAINGNFRHTGSVGPTAPLLNQGTIAIAAATTLTSGGSSCGDATVSVTNAAGGAINATGTGTLSAVNFTQGAGTLSGTTPVTLGCGSLAYTGAGTGNILVTGGVNLSGTSHTGQALRITAASSNTNAVATGGFTNGGTITLDCPGGGCSGGPGGAPMIDARASTLVNNGTITVTPAASGSGGFAGNVTNTGTIAINGNARHTGSIGPAATLLNQGTIAIAAATTLTSAGSSCGDATVSVNNAAGGKINATGTGTLSAINYTQGAGTTAGSAPVTLGCGTLAYTGAGAGKVLATGGISLSGASHAGQSLTITAASVNTNAIATGGFTNGGTITLDCPGGGCTGGTGGAPSIGVGAGTLTNTGTITVTAAAAGSGGITGNLTSSGTLQVNGNARLGAGSGPSTTFTQSAGLTAVAAGVTFDLAPSGSAFNLTGGTVSGSGTIGATLLNTGGLVAPGAGPGTLTVAGNYAQGPAASLSIAVDGVAAGQFSKLAVTGSATVDGGLRLIPGAGYVVAAAAGDSLAVLTYGGTLSGTFSTTTVAPALAGGRVLTPAYDTAGKRVNAVVSQGAVPPGTLPPPGGTGTPAPTPTPTPTPATTAPKLSALRLSPTSFTARTGSTLRATLSSAASITVVISQRSAGRRSGGRCQPKARTGKRCTLTVRRATLRFNGVKGANRFALRSPRLKPGRYTATITATTAGRTSKAIRISFTIKRA